MIKSFVVGKTYRFTPKSIKTCKTNPIDIPFKGDIFRNRIVKCVRVYPLDEKRIFVEFDKIKSGMWSWSFADFVEVKPKLRKSSKRDLDSSLRSVLKLMLDLDLVLVHENVKFNRSEYVIDIRKKVK